jgi:serine/threonine protein kinase
MINYLVLLRNKGIHNMKVTNDPYKTLEVDSRASLTVIKGAYHALVKECHPDHNGNEDKMKQLNAAYAILSDSKSRLEYDKSKNDKIGTVIGNYRLLEAIAEGGFGRTYKAEQILTKELVCIKHCSMISAAHDSVLIEESKSIWDLRHYGLPVMRDLQRLDDGSLALIMSYISGYTLEKVVEKAGKLDPETMAWITERILNTLMYLHHHGVIHGDIKPQNIIVQPETHSVVLVDFGLAMVKPKSNSTSLGYTPIYASPEQISGKVLLPASDYYSLGMVMMYGLKGGKNMDKKVVPNTVPDAMANVIAKMTKDNILSRPQKDLFDEFIKIRQESFGRVRTGMRGIPGFTI